MRRSVLAQNGPTYKTLQLTYNCVQLANLNFCCLEIKSPLESSDRMETCKLMFLLCLLVVLCGSTDSFGFNFPRSLRSQTFKHFRGGLLQQQVGSTVNEESFPQTVPDFKIPTQASAESSSPPHKSFGFFKKHLNLSFGEKIIGKFLSMIMEDTDLVRIISKALNVIFWVFLALSTAGTIGVDTKPFLSLLSIGGLTIGFALRDLLNTTFAGMFLLFSRPFTKGSVISTNGFKGTVLKVDWHYVKLADFESKQTIMIPLNLVYAAPIVVEKY